MSRFPSLFGNSPLTAKPGISLEWLQQVELVDRHGQVELAAGGDESRASGYTRNIRKLEKFFEFRVMHSDRSTVWFTPEGAELVRLTRNLLCLLEDAIKPGARPARVYRIGAGASLLHWVVIPGLKEVMGSIEDASFRLADLSNSEIVRGLEEGTLDYGLLRHESLRPPLDWAPLGMIEYVLCAPHALLNGVLGSGWKIRLPEGEHWKEAIARLPLVSNLQSNYVQSELDAVLAGHGIRTQVRLRCDTFPNAMAALRSGKFATLMLRLPGLDFLPDQVTAFPLPFLDHTHRKIYLAWNRRLYRQRSEAPAIGHALTGGLAWDRPEESRRRGRKKP